MSSPTVSLNVGLTKAFPCSYLPEQEEQLIMLIEPQNNASHFYPMLLTNGFRRSGEQVYRPQCAHCQACQSLRISPNNFKKSHSQKRLSNKNKHFHVRISELSTPQYFQLYQRYINNIHADGPMYPASRAQYEEFINSSWTKPLFIEIYDKHKLISVSVTDQVNSSTSHNWSAFYCFFDPDYRQHSLGKFAILQQIELAKQSAIDWLYLGYYIENCQKMNYKVQFTPHQRFVDGQWLDFNA